MAKSRRKQRSRVGRRSKRSRRSRVARRSKVGRRSRVGRRSKRTSRLNRSRRNIIKRRSTMKGGAKTFVGSDGVVYPKPHLQEKGESDDEYGERMALYEMYKEARTKRMAAAKPGEREA